MISDGQEDRSCPYRLCGLTDRVELSHVHLAFLVPSDDLGDNLLSHGPRNYLLRYIYHVGGLERNGIRSFPAAQHDDLRITTIDIYTFQCRPVKSEDHLM